MFNSIIDNSIKPIVLGIKRSWLGYTKESIIIFTSIWNIAGPVITFAIVDLTTIPKTHLLTASIVVSLLLAAILNRSPKSVNIKIASTGTILTISFGNIFSKNGLRVIGVNDRFDTKICKAVSINSLHGKVVKRILNSIPNVNRLIRSQIHSPNSVGSYKIGTYAHVEYKNDQYLLFALSHTNAQTNKAEGDIPSYLAALSGMWYGVRNTHNGNKVILPLLGNGLLNLGLPPKLILNLLVSSLFTASKSFEVCKEVEIVISQSLFEDIDLKQIKEYWRY